MSRDHFEQEIKEWTRRKHKLLERYVKPAVGKLNRLGKPVGLIDGFAGANEYAGVPVGSTAIMCEQGTSFSDPADHARVFACEPDSRRYESLVRACKHWIDHGVLTTYQTKHSEAVPEIQKQAVGKPCIVFLDPMKNTEFSIADDLEPWARRPMTDILGVFFHGQACRTVMGYAKNKDRVHPSVYLGDRWESAKTDDDALSVFSNQIEGLGKAFARVYPLRKQDVNVEAYCLYALSDSEHGMWLFSEAISKDMGLLAKHDSKDATPDMFAPEEAADAEARLLEFMRPYVLKHPDWDAKKLGPYLLAQSGGLSLIFGSFSGTDITRIRKRILEERKKDA